MTTPIKPRTRHPLALRLQCRKEWVEGSGTLAEVALRHNVLEQTLVAWYRRDNWTTARNRWREKQLSDSSTPTVPRGNPSQSTFLSGDETTRKIQRLQAQLESLDNALDVAKTPDDWQKLSAARQRLFDQWRILSGLPLPGSLRPKKFHPTYTLPVPVPIPIPRRPDPVT